MEQLCDTLWQPRFVILVGTPRQVLDQSLMTTVGDEENYSDKVNWVNYNKFSTKIPKGLISLFVFTRIEINGKSKVLSNQISI